ncbi:hypothetical protein G6011_05779 [Alternaria panax]|uniref:Uncharacterized protein n=1 Tax=Alternaria panax TaxID=48097 RepID=A0AAD4FFC7_9PLEO|nr:hypothetical protein G6011_05779 [Alternaria panax]
MSFTLPALRIPSFFCVLGEIQRVEGYTDSWQWVMNELKRHPRDFAIRAEKTFLHRELYRNMMQVAIHTALSMPATYYLLNDNTQHIMFQAVDTEVFDLLETPPSLGVDSERATNSRDNGIMTLVEELARLQALVLYQMIRMYDGGLEQRAVVDLL